ncbi:glycoside hydrolase family 2 protein [Cronobacter dublinensis]|uniref:glycoside hydrolase family 2 protein n=1 Tax=Cronobacter dublinensis TaxID=413497 RepID=UPI003AE7312B
MKQLACAVCLLTSGAGYASPTPSVPVPVSWSLAGDWRAHDGNDAAFVGQQGPVRDWRTLRVPANWYTQGLDHQGVLWYRHEFTLPPLPADTMATLQFDGVDYYADAWLNRQPLGKHEGYFQRFAYDISDKLQRHNKLAVRVDSPFEDPKTIWPLHKTMVKGVLNQHDTRPGGAWSPRGQDANSGGIWAPVRLHLSRGVTVDNLILRPDWQQGLDKPQLRVELVYRATTAREVELVLRARPANFAGEHFTQQQKVRLEATGATPQRLTFTLPMERARLWWPKGYGFPHLYRVSATFSDDQGVMEQIASRTGLRQIVEQPDNQGWVLNGKRIFIKGSNYIGSPWLSEMDEKKYRRDIQLVLDMNANAIRVHGHVAGRPLYRMADEMGLMIWQDVPLQWGYNDSEAFAENAARQSLEMTEQIGNSPAIIAWGGHNEPPWNSPWMEKRFPDWNNNLNRVLTERVADALAKDNSRIVHRYSAVEEHYWQGWYFGVMTDVLQPAKTGIITEFGAQALPKLSTLNTIIPADKRWPASTKADDPDWTVWKYHNFQPFQTFGFAKIPRGENMEQFIHNTQKYQADLVGLAAESYRRQRYQPVTALFHFMFVETWPSINWGVVDYLRQPKAGYYALQRAYQPLLPSIEPVTLNWRAGTPGVIKLWTVNDSFSACDGCTLRWRVKTPGVTGQQESKPMTIPPDSGRQVAQLTFTPTAPGALRIEYEILDAQGKTVGRNFYETTVAP